MLTAGECHPDRLADLARGRVKTKRAALIELLDGRFGDHHGELARVLFDQIELCWCNSATFGSHRG
ncbi:hypothetical protein A5760_00400 [Mycobacterium colombiense]|uniref:Transposase n=1 Tax=Mycobacterium colombiense TaxID=339268 RepID=A0A1A0VRZ7_9MYCO|nr:hypothetical protein [Mycobacterium colombiense]OBB85979.1 hypothetical protein A5760_00400 [Mycobacterium colombiense]